MELKKKWQGTVFKRRTAMTLREADAYLNQGQHPPKNTQIFKELDYFLDFYTPTPKLFLAYDRIACYSLGNPDIRITFDAHIRRHEENLWLSKGDFGNLLLKEQAILMEIKIPDALPLWLASLLSTFGLYPISFSKHGAVYTEKILQSGRTSLCSQQS